MEATFYLCHSYKKYWHLYYQRFKLITFNLFSRKSDLQNHSCFCQVQLQGIPIFKFSWWFIILDDVSATIRKMWIMMIIILHNIPFRILFFQYNKSTFHLSIFIFWLISTSLNGLGKCNSNFSFSTLGVQFKSTILKLNYFQYDDNIQYSWLIFVKMQLFPMIYLHNMVILLSRVHYFYHWNVHSSIIRYNSCTSLFASHAF